MINYSQGDTFAHGTKYVIRRSVKDGTLKADIDQGQLPFELNQDGQPVFRIQGSSSSSSNTTTTIRPVEIAALLLLEAKRVVEQDTGKDVGNCVITIPTYFSDLQRQAVLEAARVARLPCPELLYEPTAVALAYLGPSRSQDGLYFIIDVGGGTTDCSLVYLVNSTTTTSKRQNFYVKSTSGDNSLGGNNFLHVLTALFRQRIQAADLSDKELMRMCESAKRDPDNFLIHLNGIEYQVSAQDYGDALEPCLGRIAAVMEQCLQDEKPRSAIIAGGATKLHLLREFIETKLKSKIKGVKILPGSTAPEAVAEGAAIKAGNTNVRVQQVLNRSLGIATQGDKMTVIIPKNEPLPAHRTTCFRTHHPTTTKIDLYEGEKDDVSSNHFLDTFLFQAPAGHDVVIIMDVTLEGIQVQVELEGTEDAINGKLEVKWGQQGLKESEMEELCEAAMQRFRSSDKLKRKTKAPVKGGRKRRKRC